MTLQRRRAAVPLQNPNPNAAAPPPAANNAAPNANNQPAAGASNEAAAAGDQQQPANLEEPNEAVERPALAGAGPIRLAFTFFFTFFTSLIPERPRAAN